MQESTDVRRAGFALVRDEMTSYLDTAKVSEFLAPLLRQVRADLQLQLTESPGVLAREVPEPIARQAAQTLTQMGFSSRAIPEEKVIEPPKEIELNQGGWTEKAFVAKAGHVEYRLEPEKVVFFDVVMIPEHVQEREYTQPAHSYDRPYTVKESSIRTETTWHETLHVVVAGPLRRYQIPCDKFRYHWPDGNHPRGGPANFLKLAQLFRFRCPLARTGKGFSSLLGDEPRNKRRVNNEREYYNQLTQELTMLFLDGAGN